MTDATGSSRSRSAHATGLSYEQRLLVNEVTFYEAAAGGPIPQVVHSELDPGHRPGRTSS